VQSGDYVATPKAEENTVLCQSSAYPLLIIPTKREFGIRKGQSS